MQIWTKTRGFPGGLILTHAQMFNQLNLLHIHMEPLKTTLSEASVFCFLGAAFNVDSVICERV